MSSIGSNTGDVDLKREPEPAEKAPSTSHSPPIVSPVTPEAPNLLHQITADFLNYESRTRTFLKSLLPNNSLARSGECVSEATSEAVSNESQNLQGFEGLLHESDGGHYRGRGSSEDDDDDDDDLFESDEPDGEDCSSNSSGVYNYEYRDRRLRQILAGSDRESNDGTPSASRSRNGSMEQRQSGGRQRKGSSGSRGQPHNEPAVQEIVPWDLKEQLLKLQSRLAKESDRFLALDLSRRCAVLRVAKGSLQRAYDLCDKYSQLIDRFALQMISFSDVESVLSRNCFMYLADPKLCKDGKSAVLWVSAARLPTIPKEDKKTFQKQECCTSLLRALLYMLETHRFGGSAARQSIAKRSRGRSVNSNQSESSPPTPQASGTPRNEQGGEAPQQKHPPRRVIHVDPPSVVVLVDVSNTDSAKLNALVQLLSTASDLFRSSYPMKIRAVVISATDSTQFAGSGPDQVPTASEPTMAPSSEALPVPPEKSASTTPKKPFAFVSSLFNSNSKKISNSAEQTRETHSSSSATPNAASRMWLSVMVSTWKLRFLPPTIRSRTTMADFSTVVDPQRLTRLLLTTSKVQQDSPSP